MIKEKSNSKFLHGCFLRLNDTRGTKPRKTSHLSLEIKQENTTYTSAHILAQSTRIHQPHQSFNIDRKTILKTTLVLLQSINNCLSPVNPLYSLMFIPLLNASSFTRVLQNQASCSTRFFPRSQTLNFSVLMGVAIISFDFYELA